MGGTRGSPLGREEGPGGPLWTGPPAVSFPHFLYYRTIATSLHREGYAILQRMLRIGSSFYRIDGLAKTPTTALCSFVNQLDTARRFM